MTRYEKLSQLIEQWTRAEIMARYASWGMHNEWGDYFQQALELQGKIRKLVLGNDNILELGYEWHLIPLPDDVHTKVVSIDAKRKKKAKRMRIVHCKREEYDVYIGRASKWGNPFRIGTHGTRKEVIEKYRRWVLRQPTLLNSLDEICGKVLGCWCTPKPCHGQVLIDLCMRDSTDPTIDKPKRKKRKKQSLLFTKNLE